MKKKNLVIKAYAQRTIFGTVDYMNGESVLIKDSKETVPVKTLNIQL